MIPKALGGVFPALQGAQRDREVHEVACMLQIDKDVVLEAFKRYNNNKDLVVNYLLQSFHGQESKDNLSK
jgi:hypothetical protein